MSHQPWNQVWSVSLRLQGITAEGKHAQRCLEFSSSWLQSHPAKGQFQICILFTTNSMKHWAISTRPRHAHSASTHGTRVCTFHLGTLLPSDILWLSFPPWWTGSEHSRAQTTAQIVYSSHSAVCMWTIRSVVYITRTQSLTHTHIHTNRGLQLEHSPHTSGGCLNGTTACAPAALPQPHLVSLTGCPKGSDSLLAVIGVAEGDADIPVAASGTLWVHDEDWSVLSSRGLATTVAWVLGLHASRCLTNTGLLQ